MELRMLSERALRFLAVALYLNLSARFEVDNGSCTWSMRVRFSFRREWMFMIASLSAQI
jgi:hypothetical protein